MTVLVAVAPWATPLRIDGLSVVARPLLPDDEPRVAALFSGLSRESLRLRFMAYISRVPPEIIRELVQIDEEREVALVAALPAPGGDKIIGMASYHLASSAERAEVAFAVADEWQNKGIGTFFLKSLIRIARSRGVAGLDGQTFLDNRAMRALLTKSGCPVRTDFVHGVLDFHIELVEGQEAPRPAELRREPLLALV